MTIPRNESPNRKHSPFLKPLGRRLSPILAATALLVGWSTEDADPSLAQRGLVSQESPVPSGFYADAAGRPIRTETPDSADIYKVTAEAAEPVVDFNTGESVGSGAFRKASGKLDARCDKDETRLDLGAKTTAPCSARKRPSPGYSVDSKRSGRTPRTCGVPLANRPSPPEGHWSHIGPG